MILIKKYFIVFLIILYFKDIYGFIIFLLIKVIMSDNEAVEIINKTLEHELEGIDYEAIANSKLKSLEKDYANTIAAKIEIPEVINVNDYGWEADFSNQEYQQCPSDEEEVTEEIPQNYHRDLHLPPENIEKIKRIMAGIQIKVPFWAKNLPDDIFSENLKKSILK